MHCLVVKAHPLDASLCTSMTQKVITFLENLGHNVQLEDLYAEQFDATMSPAERQSYYEGPYQTQALNPQMERLLSAEAIVLVFPTWWFGFPAILKGWFDRVWGPGVAYDHDDNFGPIKPRLSNLREMLVVTSLGAPWWIDRLVMRTPVKRVLKTAIIGTCAPKCRFQMVSMYKSERLTSVQVTQFQRRIEKALSKWQGPQTQSYPNV